MKIKASRENVKHVLKTSFGDPDEGTALFNTGGSLAERDQTLSPFNKGD